jgi:hypothetical protein
MGLIYEVVASHDHDVVVREIEVHVNGEIFTYTTGVKENYVLPPMNEGVNVTIKIRDQDDAGNWSDWSEPYTFDTKDTIKPKMPGAVAVNLIEEVGDAEPSPEPEAEDTVDLPADHVVKFF